MTPHEVSVLRLAPAAQLPPVPEGWGVEVVVLSGDWKLPEGTLHRFGYSRRPPPQAGAGTTQDGCSLYLRTSCFAPDDRELVHIPAGDPWRAGQGNLQVKSLHANAEGGTALVRWPAGERFVPHRHWGGEEVFVLSGTFQDEHGTYPTGTWYQAPHLSSHHPFVQDETLIFVKTGHLPMPGPGDSPATPVR